MRTSVLDVSAISLSSLCLVHCLALPLLAATLPLAGVLSEAEWVHQLMALLALPVTLSVIVFSANHRLDAAFLLLALSGLALLLAAAFVEALHDHEVALTTLGALSLAAAHGWRWYGRSKLPAPCAQAQSAD